MEYSEAEDKRRGSNRRNGDLEPGARAVNRSSIVAANNSGHTQFGKRGGKFRRELLPVPGAYYQAQGLKLIGRGEWRSALCPFHPDRSPSLRVRLASGGYRCMACGEHGGDVLAFHMRRYAMQFVAAAKALDAWEEVAR
jgi:hypothetical protein